MVFDDNDDGKIKETEDELGRQEMKKIIRAKRKKKRLWKQKNPTDAKNDSRFLTKGEKKEKVDG